MRFAGYHFTMPAIRKLDEAAVEQIVAGRAAGQSVRQIGAHPDLTWMQRQGESRNFESDEVVAALADGWTPHE